jgi:hypothetical protein
LQATQHKPKPNKATSGRFFGFGLGAFGFGGCGGLKKKI